MEHESRLFTKLNDDNAWRFFLQSPEEFLVSVDAGDRPGFDESAMANQFSMAANLLRDAAIKSGVPWFYTHPILYLYRHTIELYLKAIIPISKPTHDLVALRDLLIEWVKDQYGPDLSQSWIAETITEFAIIDPDSTRFRYTMNNRGNRNFDEKHHVNLDTLKTRLDALFLWFKHFIMAKSAISNTSQQVDVVSHAPRSASEPL